MSKSPVLVLVSVVNVGVDVSIRVDISVGVSMSNGIGVGVDVGGDVGQCWCWNLGVSKKYALRVLPAETRLTVYRRRSVHLKTVQMKIKIFKIL